MNLIKNSTNEETYLRLGSTWLIDSIYLFIIPIFSFIGFILNYSCYFAFISYVDLSKAKLYKYLIVYSFNSSLLCLLHAFTFLTFSPRYFQHSFLYYNKFYRCKILAYLSTSLCLFGNLLDILIALDRLSTFLSARLNYLINLTKPFTKCFLFFIFSLFINIPILYSFRVIENDKLFNENDLLFCAQTDFARSNTGIVLNLTLISLRDILTLLIEIILACLSTYYYKTYPSSNSSIKNYIITTKSLNFQTKLRKTPKIKRQLILISVYLSLLSILFHLIIFTVSFFVSVFPKHMLKIYIYILSLIILVLIKNSFNVLILFKFNNEFKKHFKQINFLTNKYS
jgi:hypothetical protein